MTSRRTPLRSILATGFFVGFAAGLVAAEPTPLTLVVMDPLALPLSCPCVAGYAQRDYEKLGKFLEGQIGRPVKVEFAETLTGALEKKTQGKADLVIGKYSVVQAGAKKHNLGVTPVAALTGKDGATTQTGLVVVPAKDPALTVADLKGYRIIFGPEECDEKHAAALALLGENGITPKEQEVQPKAKVETCSACSDGAETILQLGPNVRAATVISSYAAPLLEGCGHVKKGDLRVVGTTAPVPFVTAFVNDALSGADRDAVTRALFRVKDHPPLLAALETKGGFVPVPTTTAKKK
ncbi:MAG TPA: PhnD/SsuA/transferrin family substrate-binding protein [Gemmataceae bacterium]|jgi:ABC-type phosphate/phosphonate transport system substrate-binding protein|nr:PhnD/SsuA/transferrin family substrate-binding protein [Gemmataceae bacterium]